MNIKIYGAEWCVDCVNTKNFFKSNAMVFDYIDITDNKEAIAFVESVNNGKRVIPTLIIDKKIYTNPGISFLMKMIDSNNIQKINNE